MTKSRKKILLSSIAMLLVALVALGSATFAWFTVNKTVTANNIVVKAATAQGLQITGTNGSTVENMADSGWVRDYSFKKTGLILNPISVSYTAEDGMAENGYYPADNKANGVATAADSKDWQTLAVPASPATNNTNTKDAYTDNDYIAAYRIGLKSTDGTIEDVTGNIAVQASTTTAHNADKFVRAVLVDSNGAIVASYSDGAASTNAITGLGTAVDGKYPYDSSKVAAQAAAKVTSDQFDVTTTPQYFTLYVWFEGQDAECVDANQDAQITFSLSFTF